jgi:cytochrome c-type biogenesis protein CcmH
MTILRVLVLFCLALAFPALAVIETYEFSSPELEKRYHQLSQELRCPKCQNQNIADSNAPIAQDLRRLLYQQLESGANDQEILDYMVARYGEFVRYRPAFDRATAVLWFAPLILLLLAAVTVFMVLRRRDSSDTPALDAAEQQRLQELLSDAGKHSR